MLYCRLTVMLKQIISNNKNHLYFLLLGKYFIISWLVKDINALLNRALEINLVIQRNTVKSYYRLSYI